MGAFCTSGIIPSWRISVKLNNGGVDYKTSCLDSIAQGDVHAHCQPICTLSRLNIMTVYPMLPKARDGSQESVRPYLAT